ncbi:septum formation protein Maf [Fusobacterium sp. oral taxon 370 str. F0437]|nr:septum formation protein Maf [Fusobacterium sp. oral taxon 370 str. F0437]
MSRMILASNSKRRQEILKDMGFNFKVITADIEEVSDKKDISERILDIAEKKLDKIAKDNINNFVLAADTVVALDGEVFGKPKDREEAEKFLKLLSGKTHKVITAYVFKNISKNILIKDVVVSEVKFYDLDKETINWYLDTVEPFDKAGGYGIQGLGRALVEKIEGDYFAIMGFPISNFLKNLRKIGYKISQIDRI